jgi:hypothetical protein
MRTLMTSHNIPNDALFEMKMRPDIRDKWVLDFRGIEIQS